MDNFYKGLSEEDHKNADKYNFDHPDAIDFDEIYEVVKKLLKYEDAEIPNYDFATHSRTEEKTHIYKSYFILFEGILALHDKRICDLMDLKLFVNEDDDVRLCRRIKRDISERGRDVLGVISQWHGTVKSSFDEFIKPTMKHSDLIVQGNETNKNAIQFIVDSLTIKMINMGIAKKQIEAEETKINSKTAHKVHTKMDMESFDKIVNKLIEEKEFEEMHLIYLIKKLKEFYRFESHHKITLLKNLNTKTSLKKGNLIKTKSVGGANEISQINSLLVFEASLQTQEDIDHAIEKINIIDHSITHVDILALFGDQNSLQKLFKENKIRDDLNVDVFSIGSTPLLDGHSLNIDLANDIFISEFRG